MPAQPPWPRPRGEGGRDVVANGSGTSTGPPMWRADPRSGRTRFTAIKRRAGGFRPDIRGWHGPPTPRKWSRVNDLWRRGPAPSAAEERQLLRPVELGAGDGWQVEHVGDQVGEVAVTDRLLSAVAGARGAGTAEGGIHRVEVAPGGHPGTPSHEGDAVVLQPGRVVV